MPDIMRDELFHPLALWVLDEVFRDFVKWLGDARDILNEDVIASDHHLCLLLGWITTWCLVCRRLLLAVLPFWLEWFRCAWHLSESLTCLGYMPCRSWGITLCESWEVICRLGTIPLFMQATLLLLDESVTLLSRWLATCPQSCCLSTWYSLLLAFYWVWLLEEELLIWFRWSNRSGTWTWVKSILTDASCHLGAYRVLSH